ncbi:tRNA preQ1(34) S-adenosylmethionine ribosyltransferase-isomerase QueA [candidate division GN15 bacterium]|nr:tRNA preQ1(34) S-adenosylmethionine ribosyltransferase-isomerase QueA [candidate division GN15 bacterium]
MDVALFDYHLPSELIAQFPARQRSKSRLLVLDREADSISHGRFSDIIDHIKPGDALVVNNTKVFKARLLGHRHTGGQVEVFLVRKMAGDSERWQALVRPSRRLKEGEIVWFDDRRKVVLERNLGDGAWRVVFSSLSARRRIVARFGHVPLPQYISRDDQPSDIRRYQTVFADSERVGAVAAPTAGFHFTRGLLDRVRELGVTVIELTLHVGPGTFKPITADDVDDHVVDPEYADLPAEAANQINRVRENGGSIFAVGTTSVRTLESATIAGGEVQPLAGMVNLYIKPGHRFRLVDHLVTNFHLPRSSLLVLVSAFAGRERILAAYREAIERRYRFYSYGDAMLIL